MKYMIRGRAARQSRPASMASRLARYGDEADGQDRAAGGDAGAAGLGEADAPADHALEVLQQAHLADQGASVEGPGAGGVGQVAAEAAEDQVDAGGADERHRAGVGGEARVGLGGHLEGRRAPGEAEDEG